MANFKPVQLSETIYTTNEFKYPAYVSEKLDGVRCVIIDGVMYTRSKHLLKPNIQAHFKPLCDAAKELKVVLDGELYYPQDNFGGLMSTLSASIDRIKASGIKFHAFDILTNDEWEADTKTTPFDRRLEMLKVFAKHLNRDDIFEVVKQVICKFASDAKLIYDTVCLANGEGVMIRSGSAVYEHRRTNSIVKLKHWLTCEAKIIAIHQQACPVKYADEVHIENGKQQGYKLTAGSVTVEVLPDQPLQAGQQQNATFCGCEGVDSVQLRKDFWTNRENLIGKTVEFSYLKGAGAGRMARIMRLRPDKD